MENKKISVVIPCYNHEKYVEKSILSVINQSYKNIELIVIDDGSSDSSCSIIEKLANLHGFKFIPQKNMGVCKTLNKAITQFSSGEYIALLASDDYWDPEKLEKQMKALVELKTSEFCFTKAIEFDSKSGEKLKEFPKSPFTGDVLKKVFLRQHVPAGSILFTRRLYDSLSGFDESLVEEDWDFVIRCAANTQFSAVNECLLYYRSHMNNTMVTRSRRKIFHQKARILSKNYMLVSPTVWLRSMLSHFIYDHFLVGLGLSRIKKLFNS